MNKKSILFVATVIIFSLGMKPVKGQVTLLHSFEGLTTPYLGQPSTDFVGFCVDDEQNHTVKLYNKNCQLIKTINVPIHYNDDDGVFYSFMPSQKIVNNDDLYEIIIFEEYYDGSHHMYNYIINENSQIVFDFGNDHNSSTDGLNYYDSPHYGYFYIGGSWILCTQFYNGQSDYNYNVYSCAGSAQNVIPATQQYQSSFIDVYPNPTNDKLIVHSPNSFSAQSASVYGENGVEELSIPLLTNGQEIDVSSLPRGVHFLRIVTDKGVTTKRFVRQ